MRASLGCLLLVLAGCDENGAATPADAAWSEAAAPLLGEGGVDAPDHGCNVVLRSARRAVGDNGLPVVECDGACWFVWDVFVDVADAALAEGVEPGLLLHSTLDAPWYEVGGEAAPNGAPGFVRYHFRVAHGGLPTGLGGSAMAAAAVEVIPFLRTRFGPRVFDHNVYPEPLDNYRLAADNGWAAEPGPAVCAAAPQATPEGAALSFDGDFGHHLEGDLRAGGRLSVDYALERLPQCFGDTYMGRAAWNTNVYGRFLGDDLEERFSAPLVECADPACATPTARRVSFPVPEAARRVELWFATAGRSCGVHWDSDFGRNYGFDVAARPGWVGGAVAAISRAGGEPCEGGGAVEGAVGYGTWARTRAVRAHLCFRAWIPGVTDVPDSGAPVDAAVRCRWGEEAEWRTHGLSRGPRAGNDATFALDLRTVDPFAPYRCPDVPTATEAAYETATAECVAVVNGFEFGPARDGDPLTLRYEDYPDDPWRAANCPR